MTEQDRQRVERLISELEHRADLSGINLHVYTALGHERTYRSQARNAIYVVALRSLLAQVAPQ
jgi:hypothetical protein